MVSNKNLGISAIVSGRDDGGRLGGTRGSPNYSQLSPLTRRYFPIIDRAESLAQWNDDPRDWCSGSCLETNIRLGL